MQIELLEIQDFLAAHPPFDHLPPETLQTLPKALTIRYQRRGQNFPPQHAEPAIYLIRQGAVELRNTQGVLIEKLAEGDLYTAACEQASNNAMLKGICTEDCLLYTFDCARFTELCRQFPAFSSFFYASLRQKLQRVLTTLQQQPPQDTSLLEAPIWQIMNREPVTASPDIKIIEAAQLMTHEHLSSLLLLEKGKLCGILTDHDLRSRCIARGVDPSQTVRTIMSTQLQTIPSNAPIADAMLLMNKLNLHHLPVVDEDSLRGIITSNDLLRQQANNPIQFARRLHEAQSREELIDASQHLPSLQQQMVNANMSAYRIGQVISSIVDALTQRLLTLAHRELGEAPIAYTWLGVGSLARQEMHVGGDQDNALLLSDDYEITVHGEFFARLAAFVCDGLAACGIRYCPGEIMASNPQWRQPLKVWHNYFTDWIKTPTPKEVMLACNFFDIRAVAGELDLLKQLFSAAIEQVQSNQIFLAHLAANTVRHEIPLGFFRQFVLVSEGEHHDRLDLKRGGVIPITELARLFALTAGVTTLNSYERLQQASEKNALSPSGAADLHDALEMIETLRLRHQAAQIAQGHTPDNFIDPQHLSPFERQILKDAFAILRDMHSMLAQRYQTERFYT